MTRLRPWAIVGLVIVAIALLGLAACAPAPRVVVVRCDYGIVPVYHGIAGDYAVPVGYHGFTAQDSADEAWRDSAICQMRIDMARAGIEP